MMASRKSLLVSAAAAGSLMLSGAALPHQQHQTSTGPSAGLASERSSPQWLSPDEATHRSSETTSVLLPTGDRVTLQHSAAGPQAWVSPSEASIELGRGYAQSQTNDSLQIIPRDLLPLVPDRLDPRLFDVLMLAEVADGETVRVIVELVDTNGLAPLNDAAALQSLASGFTQSTGIAVNRQLTSISSVSADVAPAEFAELLDAVQADPGVSPVNKVWLAGPVRATLDDSTAQIGAPAAWEQGLTGTDSLVAVLDTGIDTTHPDVSDRVVGEGNFSDSPDTNDPFGHGTHVAGIIAGTGSVNPDYTGVAYGAELLNGKVLDDDGFGTEDGIIAGMEWAADEGADIVNMSLGGWPTDGTDPMSVALNNLTESSGTLFVVAAGNDGWDGHYTVGTPGSADLALTVGSVDELDILAFDSSLGPRVGDDAIKPDVTAPGEGIISGRAEGVVGDPDDEYYVEFSGTSMAAPHVAGAAAILLQDRPDLTHEQLKAILMGSATSTSDTVWEEGAGRIVIPDALNQDGYATPASLSFGAFEYPQDDLAPVTDEVTYHNLGDADLDLDLTVEVFGDDGAPAPAGTVEISADQVTIPADGQATLEVTVNPAVTDIGLHSGVVIGTDADGATLRIPLGFHNEPELFDVTISVLDWEGQPADEGYINIFDMAEGDILASFDWAEDGSYTARLTEGTYFVSAVIDDFENSSTALLMEPNVVVDGDSDIDLVFDASESVPITVDTHLPSVPIDQGIAHAVMDEEMTSSWHLSIGAFDWQFYSAPTEVAEVGTVEFQYNERREAPAGLQLMELPPRDPYRYDFFTWDDQVPADLTFVADESTTARLQTIHRTMSAENWTVVDEGRGGSNPDSGLSGFTFLFPMEIPHERIEYVSSDVLWDKVVFGYTDWESGLFDADYFSPPQIYDAGDSLTEEWGGQVHSSGLLDVHLAVFDDELFVDLPGYLDSAGRGGFPGDFTDVRMQVWGDGELWEDTDVSFGFYPLPGPTEVRVLLELERDEDWWPLSTYSATEWTFSTEPDAGYLPVMDVRIQPDHLSADNLVAPMIDLDLVVSHQAWSETTATIEGVTLEWSADGDWTEVVVTEVEPGRYHAQIAAPVGVDTVDLRASAVDSDGSTVTTEVHDALGVESPVLRIAGADRYGTSAELARRGGYSPHVYLTSGVNYPDALAIAGIAGSEHAPVVLTAPGQLSDEVRESLTDVQATQVTIIGGPDAVSPAVEQELADLGVDVDRIGGTNRYHTAALLAEGAPEGGTVYVASGEVYADALAAGPMTAAEGLPVLLTRGGALPATTRAALQDLAPAEIVLVGGSDRVSDAVLADLNQIAPAERVGGSNRFHTAALLAERHDAGELGSGFESSTAYLAAGHAWPDALTLAARAGAQGSPILLVRQDSVPATTADALESLDSRRAFVLGGPDVIADTVLEDLVVLLTP